MACGLALYLAGRGGLALPDIKGWINENCPAIDSPPLLAALRPQDHQEQEARTD